MKTLVGAIVEILASLALFALGTLLAVFFIVIFLIWGWPLTILLLIVVAQKLYFYSHGRRRSSSRFDWPRRYVQTPISQSVLRLESGLGAGKDSMNGIDEHVPRLLN